MNLMKNRNLEHWKHRKSGNVSKQKKKQNHQTPNVELRMFFTIQSIQGKESDQMRNRTLGSKGH